MNIIRPPRQLPGRRRFAGAIAGLLAVAAVAGAPLAASEPPYVAAPGMAVHHSDGTRCTLGYTATNREGSRLAVTAGHCGAGRLGEVIYDRYRRPLGRYVAARGDNIPARTYGYALIALRPGVHPTAALSSRTAITGTGAAAVGEAVCIFAVATGSTCSTVAAVTDTYGIIADSISDGGDSGGPVIRAADGALVGIVIGHSDRANSTSYQPLADTLARMRVDGEGGTSPAPIVRAATLHP